MIFALFCLFASNMPPACPGAPSANHPHLGGAEGGWRWCAPCWPPARPVGGRYWLHGRFVTNFIAWFALLSVFSLAASAAPCSPTMPARSRPLPGATLHCKRTRGTAWTLLKSLAKSPLKPLPRTRSDTKMLNLSVRSVRALTLMLPVQNESSHSLLNMAKSTVQGRLGL